LGKAVFNCSFNIKFLGDAISEFALASPAFAFSSASVKTNYGDISHRGQTIRSLLKYMAIHHAAMRGPWMQAEYRSIYFPRDWRGYFSYKTQSIFSLDCDWLSPRRQHRARTN
jgi:hypothetical protein